MVQILQIARVNKQYEIGPKIEPRGIPHVSVLSLEITLPTMLLAPAPSADGDIIHRTNTALALFSLTLRSIPVGQSVFCSPCMHVYGTVSNTAERGRREHAENLNTFFLVQAF